MKKTVGIIVVVAICLVSGISYQYLSTKRDLAKYPPPGIMVEVDGVGMHLNCTGTGKNTVILEGGLHSDYRVWESVQHMVSEFTRVCSYDRRGLGYSKPGPSITGAEDIASNLHRLLIIADIKEPVVMVGSSAGGIYVRAYQRKFPESVSGMVLVDSSHEQQSLRRKALFPEEASDFDMTSLYICRTIAPFGLVRLLGLVDNRVKNLSVSNFEKQRIIALYNQTHFCETFINDEFGFSPNISSDAPPARIGNLPLTVISRGKAIHEGEDIWEGEWQKLQNELAALSTNSVHIVAEKSGHTIALDEPYIIVDAVRLMLQMIDGSETKSNAIEKNYVITKVR